MKAKQVSAVAIIAVVMLLALWRIGASIYDYTCWKVEHETPVLETNPPTPAPPGTEKLPSTLPPYEHNERPKPPSDGGAPVCDMTCSGGQIIKI